MTDNGQVTTAVNFMGRSFCCRNSSFAALAKRGRGKRSCCLQCRWCKGSRLLKQEPQKNNRANLFEHLAVKWYWFQSILSYVVSTTVKHTKEVWMMMGWSIFEMGSILERFLPSEKMTFSVVNHFIPGVCAQTNIYETLTLFVI